MKRAITLSVAVLVMVAGLFITPASGAPATKPEIGPVRIDFPRDPESPGRKMVRISVQSPGATKVSVVVTGGAVVRDDRPPSSCADMRIRYGRPAPRLRFERTGDTKWSKDSRNRRVARAVSSEVQRFDFTASNAAGKTTQTIVYNTLCAGG